MRMIVQTPLWALLLWLVNNGNFVVNGFVAIPRTASRNTMGICRVSVSQSALVLSEMDTMTLNWIGLAVGTLASLWVYQNEKNQESADVSIPSNQKVLATSTVAASSVVAKKETTTTTTAVVKPVAAPSKPVVVDEKPVVAKATEATKVMKETQKEIQQTLQEVADKIESTSATVAASQSDAPVYTEPYSDKVKKSVKRKSRWVGKLTKKVLMPWKAWNDL